ncbi:MAG: winged helix-turn-helix transcriptional regulator [Promethearchaeota archaeon]
MGYPLARKREELKEMIELIPKMQESVRNGLKKHFQGLNKHNKSSIEFELQSLRKAIDIIDSKYVLDIIFVLSREGQRFFFNELKSMLSHVNVGTLSKRLKELEKDKVIDRKVFANERPIRVSYSLTEMGYGMFYLLLPMLVYVTYIDEFLK